MTSPSLNDREKVVSKLPGGLQQDLKIRTAQHRVDIQHAVEAGIAAWQGLGSNLAPVDTAGARSFSTWLPEGQWEEFRAHCAARGVSSFRDCPSPWRCGWRGIPPRRFSGR